MSRTDGLRILFVTPSLPYPPATGFRTRVFQMVRHLGARHHVSLLTYAKPYEHAEVAAMRGTCAAVHTVERMRPKGAAKRRQQLASLLSPVSFQWRQLRTTRMQRAITRVLAEARYDLVQVESSKMCGFDFPAGTRLVVDEHNIEYELLYRSYREEHSPVRKLYNWVEYRKFRREEEQAWRRAAACILTSEREEAILRRHLPGTPAVTVPNGVDTEYFRPTDVTPDPDSIVFTGLMSYRPNEDAVFWFVREILPLIRRSRPNVTFTIVGSSPPPEVERLAGPGVVVTGRVPDVRPYVERAAVCVVPLRYGSGTRLKVVEGLAMGKPLVSTALGCEGIAVRGGEHLLMADEPASFARHVLQVLDSPALAAELGRRGRALVEGRYDWGGIVRGMETFYDELLAAQPEAVRPVAIGERMAVRGEA